MSLQYRRDAMELVMERLPATLELSALAMLYAIVVAIPVGILAAVKRNTLVDYLSAVLTLFGQSMPTFWLGIMLIMIFSVNLGWLPTSGRGTWQQLILPSITLGTCYLAMLSRLTRSGFLEVWGKEYIRTARAKGLPEKTVIFKHTLKNSMIPLVTVMGLSFGGLLGGSVLTETVFEWPGIGQLAIVSIYGRDYPIQQTIVLMLGVAFIAITFITDLIYTWLDPRIRLASKE
jgi:ABC-type dipeptide/oligopeptide/nickel transport system permease component